MNNFRLTGRTTVAGSFLPVLYFLAYPGFIVVNNLLAWVQYFIHSGKFKLFIRFWAVYCRNSAPVDYNLSLINSASFIGLKLLLVPLGWALYKLLKNDALKSWLFELLICYFMFELVFAVFYPVLLLFGKDLSWYYGSELPLYYFSSLLHLPDFLVPSILALLFIGYLVYFRPYTFRQVLWRLLFCSFSIAFFVVLLELVQYAFFKQ